MHLANRVILFSAILFLVWGAAVYAEEQKQPCPQVVTYAETPWFGCEEFPTPCDMPKGWTKVDSCPSLGFKDDILLIVAVMVVLVAGRAKARSRKRLMDGLMGKNETTT